MIVDGTTRDDSPHEGRDGDDLSDEVAGEIDDVGAEVADGAGSCLRAVEPPDALVERPDALIRDLIAPVAHGLCPAVALLHRDGRLPVSPGHRDELRWERGLCQVRDLVEGTGMRLAHEGMAQHGDPDRVRHTLVSPSVRTEPGPAAPRCRT